ncbi:hypothetical protein GCM10022222_36230 [Amycolatopsis ultiminotia]|uniref:Uncharacterized protein n=2 Tax=Amycolatopsis ultiminotia TaxID=543629 RepID=A0ABP6WC75_9PSEU
MLPRRPAGVVLPSDGPMWRAVGLALRTAGMPVPTGAQRPAAVPHKVRAAGVLGPAGVLLQLARTLARPVGVPW